MNNINKLTTSTDHIRRYQMGGAIIIAMGFAYLGYGLFALGNGQPWQDRSTVVQILFLGCLSYGQARWLKRLLRFRKQLLAMAQATGIDSMAGVPEPVREAVRLGKRAEAENLYQQTTGAGFFESREVVDDIIYYQQHAQPKQP